MKQYRYQIMGRAWKNWPLALSLTVAAVAIGSAPVPARADFFDDARKTFTSDIPHFFQDDIPCAFGGEPTSGAKPTCHSKPNPPKKVKSTTTTTTTTTKTTVFEEPAASSTSGDEHPQESDAGQH